MIESIVAAIVAVIATKLLDILLDSRSGREEMGEEGHDS